MVVMMPRESWTDERLDDFRAEVNRRFDEVYRRFDEVDRKFDEVDRRFEKIEGELHHLRVDMKEGFERLYRLMITLGAGALGTLIAAFATVIATQS
jgi:predicted transcriptional regulator